MPSFTLKKLNRILLANQHLSTKASGPGSVVEASHACCGNNSQDFRESLSSFWARVEGYSDSDFQREFRPRGGLARAWTVRGTVHTFPTKDYYLHVYGSGRNRILGRYESWAKSIGVPPLEKRLGALYHPLLDEIKGRAVTSKYIKEYMVEGLTRLGLKGRVKLRRGWSSKATLGPLWTGITEMSYLGLLVSAGRSGSESLWMRASDWLPTRRKEPDPDDCSVGLAREYIARYGPVTRSDIAYWNGFLFSKDVDRCLDELRGDLLESKVEGSDATHYSLGEPTDLPEPPRVILLPEFDSMMMGYRDRSRFLERHRLIHISRPQGIISRTVLIDGLVGGTWGRRKAKDGTLVAVAPFRDFTASERRLTQEEFQRYGEYLGTSVRVVFGPRPS